MNDPKQVIADMIYLIEANAVKQERERLAELVWQDKQKLAEEILKDPANGYLNGVMLGLYRALDIIEAAKSSAVVENHA